MSDIVNISIAVQDQVSATISTVGTQGPAGSSASATTDASLLTSGTLADARLSGNVILTSAMQAALKSLDVVWKGIWSSTGSYIYGDVVGYDGEAYFCKVGAVGPTATLPSADTTKWDLCNDLRLFDSANSAYGRIRFNDNILTFTDGNGDPTQETVGLTDLARTSAVTSAIAAAASSYQPADADLLAIAGLTGTGYLQRTGVNTWSLGAIDLSSYATTSAVAAGYVALGTSVANRVPKRTGTAGQITDSGITIDASNNITGVGAGTFSGPLYVRSTSNVYNFPIAEFMALNLSAGVAIEYGGIRATGSNANSDVTVNAKGTGVVRLATESIGGVAVTGNLTASGTMYLSGPLNIGSTADGSTATPTTINMGGSFANSVTASKAKLKLYDYDGTAPYIFGIGISASQFNFFTSSTASYVWLFNDVEKARLTSSGALSLSGSVTIGSGAPITKVLSATATLDFGSIAADSYADLTITVTGAAVGDTVAIGFPNGSVLADLVWSAWVSATNTVTVRVANNSSTTARDPASGTFRATVTQF